MPCPCNFNKNKIMQKAYIKGPPPPHKLKTKSQALFTIKKLTTLKEQANLKYNEGLEFKLLPKTIPFQVINVDGQHKINLDSKNNYNYNYNENKVYHLRPGIYTLVGVPELHAIRLNKDHKNIDR